MPSAALMDEGASLGDCKQVSCHGLRFLLPPWAARCVQQDGMIQTDEDDAAHDTQLLGGGRTRMGRSCAAASGLCTPDRPPTEEAAAPFPLP